MVMGTISSTIQSDALNTRFKFPESTAKVFEIIVVLFCIQSSYTSHFAS